MLRKSNLVPNSVSSFKPEKQLNRKNIVYHKEINILLITIKWSKTIQFGETPTSAEMTQTVDNQYPDINVIIKLH
jgi:hypothetical protein